MNIEEKYEPKSMAELVFADATARATCERYATGKPYKSLMLWGPPGTAKTTTARAIVCERYAADGQDVSASEFNGAEFENSTFAKIENTAQAIRSSTCIPSFIINEFDELDQEMQAKFRSWMDRYKWITIIATTNAQPGLPGTKQKIMPALQSRFELVQLAPPSLQDWLPRAQSIFEQEGYQVSHSDLTDLLSTFSGDVRGMLPLIEEALELLQRSGTRPTLPKPALKIVGTPPTSRK